MKKLLLLVLFFACTNSLFSQTTIPFNTQPVFVDYPGIPSWKLTAEVTVGGVVYQISNGGNGGWAHATSGGESNSASLVYNTAATTSVTIKRKDNARFQFYGAWLKYTNSSGYMPPGLRVSYHGSGAPDETFNGNNEVTLIKNVNVTSVTLSFSALLNLNFDNLVIGPAIAAPPTVTTTAASQISGSMATVGGEVVNDGGGTVTERGVVYGTSPNPTVSNNKLTMGTGAGAFSDQIIGLTPSTLYYVRSYATNSAGTAYGNEVTFSTTNGSGPVTIPVNMDTSFDDAGSYGSDPLIYVGYESAFGLSKGALKFNVSSVSGTVTSAKLRVYVDTKAGTAILKAWGSNNDSWLENTSSVPSQDVSLTQVTVANVGWVDIDVTSYVAAQVGGDKIVTLVLTGSAAAPDSYVYLRSREHSTDKPELVISTATAVAPAITAQPAGTTVCSGANTSFTVSASNATSYQWQENSGSGFTNIANGGIYSGATTTTLTISGVTTGMNGYQYRCVASGSTTPAANSNAASLTVNASPAITTQPVSRTVAAGTGTTFSVTATGAATYQWQVNTGSGFTNLSNTSVYSGATTATLTLSSTTGAMNGYMYRVVVTGSCSPAAASNSVALSLRMPQTIAFTEPSSKTYGDAQFTLGDAATAEGLPVTYTAADATVVEISGNQATILKAGTTTITATQAGNAEYSPAEVTQSLVVAKRAITVTAYGGQFKMYGADDVTFSYRVTSGSLVSGDAFTGKLSRVVGESVDNYAITQGTLTAGPNYELTFVSNNFEIFKRPVTVTALPDQKKAYGETDPVFAYHITSGGLVNGDQFTGALSRAAGESVNSYAITQGTLAISTNYDLTFETNDFAITKRAITVTANTGQTKTYGETDPTLTYQITTGSLVTGDNFTGTLSRAAGEAVNTYAITQGTLAIGANYELTYIASDFAITKRAITVTANAGQTKTYGEADPTLTYQITTGNLVTGDNLIGTLSRATGEAVNNYTINQGSLTIGANYALTYVANDFAITKRAITVTANAGQAKVYGESDPIFTYQITAGNLVTGDNLTGALSRATGEAVNTYAINQGTLTVGTNYELTYAGKDFAITKRAITVTANTGQSKTYGESDPTLTYQITTGNLVTGDDFTGALSRAIGETVNTYAITQGTLAIGANYELTYVANDFAITRRAITVTANTGQTKTYGESDPTLTYQITTGSLVTGENFTGTLSRAPGEAVNTYAITQGTLAIGANYDLTYIANDFAITKRAITITADAGQTKTYGESDPTLTYQITTGNLVTGDEFTGALSRAIGEAVNTYAITQGTLSIGSNYQMTYAGDNFAITQRAITVTADAGQTKTYGESDPTFTYQITTGNLVTGDDFTGTLSRATGEAVNTYAINQGTLSAGANYALTYVANDFAITKRAIAITANAGQTKVYGESDPTLTYQITTGNLVTGDDFTGALSRATGEAVNTYAITQGTLTIGTNYELTYIANDFAITKRAITVTANAGLTKTYGEADPALTYQITTGNLVTGDDFTGALSRAPGEAVNTYAITQGTLTIGTNYELTFIANDFAITKRAITVTANAGLTKIYGESDPALTYQITTGTLVTGDDFTGALSRAPGEAVNTYAINQGTLSSGDNYELTYAGNDFAVTKRAITVTADAGQTKTYGESDPTLTYQITTGNLVGSDKFSGKLSRTAGENVGTYGIEQNTLGLSENYNLTYQGNTFTINKAALKILVDNKTRFMGTANPAFTVTYSGFVSGEDPQVLSALPVLTTGATLSSDLGEYPIVASGAKTSNYEITYQNGILKVVPGAPTTVSLAPVVIFENRAAGTAAGTLSSTSLDPNATFTYSLTSGDGDRDNKLFTISGNKLKTASTLDYEQKNTLSIRVRSTTQYGFSLDQVFTIKISDVNEIPTFSAIADETICYTTAPMTVDVKGLSAGPESNQTYELSAVADNGVFFEQLTINGKGKLTYQIKPGMTGQALVTVTIQDNGGTENGGENTFSRTFTVTVNPLPVVAITSDKGTSISKGETVQLTATGGSTYSWADAEGISGSRKMQTLTVRPTVTTTYRVQVTTASGCQAEKEITIEVKDDYQVVRGTNLVSPNGDGVNDRLVIRNIDMYPNNVVKIYDRGGRLLYSKTNYTDEWDGTFQGSPLAEGTYYYIVDFGERQLKGFITIVRD